MPNRVALGVGGLEAEPGDHICGVFTGEQERDEVLIPFLQAGLASGDKCICVIDGTAPGQIVATLGPGGEAATLTAGKQLEVIRHGRRVCHARRPACGACGVARWCPSFGTGPTDEATACKLVKTGPLS